MPVPASWYVDPAVLEAEHARVFARSWQYAGRAQAVAQPGSYLTAWAGRVPLVVVRDREGVLRAHVNVCRHRGHLVAAGEGSCSTLQCPYHAWTYALDGRLRAAPRADREPGLDLDRVALPSAAVGEWGPFVFVNPDPATEPLHEALGELPDVVGPLEGLRFHGRTEWELECNWKVAIENYLECYHCAVAHPGLAKAIDVRPDAYGLHVRERFSFQTGPRSDGAGDARWHWLWPNVTINVHPGAVSVDSWLPDGPERTRGFTDQFFAAGADAEAILEFAREVNAEDARLVAGVQAGLRSGTLAEPILLPGSERLIAHFQGLLGEALDG